ncbi:leucine-rich repeat domain-containing protein [Rhizobium sp. FKL33]|uniref:leucine-rich repeat domain-containing protein n=1 Tax=Rhizobium sp. FKL33 TaxID=2562307 RepID=UPI0010C04F7B|nr:leucine-rich repeat domain-containing protein [Rhizobium sp. FKL33]
MLEIDSRRAIDPKSVSPSEVAAAVEKLGRLTIQFSRPEAYTPELLRSVNEACRMVRDGLEIRFYGHYGQSFDAKVLRHLPDVYNLSVDCLTVIENEDEISALTNLKELSIGIFELNRPDFLKTLPLEHLQRLSISENRKRNFDLSPLAACSQLKELFIEGHSKGIEAIATLPHLKELRLRAYAKKHGLAFLKDAPALEELTLILGGRDDIDDLSSKTLTLMQIILVKGLASLGDLSRLPALRALRIEDQIQLKHLDLNGANLERLDVINCKNLSAIEGLDRQRRLQEFVASRVALDLNGLRDRDWPASTRAVWLYSGSMKWNDATEAKLAARNLAGDRGRWP